MAETTKAPPENGEGPPTLPGLEEALSGLTYKQRLFVFYYLTEAKGKSTLAAQKAGYAHPTVSGSQLLGSFNVRTALEAGFERAGLGPEELTAKLSAWIEADISDFVEFDDEGKMRIDLKRARKLGISGAIEKLTPTKYGTSVTMVPKLQAAAIMAKILGLMVDKVEATVSTSDSRAELSDRLTQLAERLRQPVPAPPETMALPGTVGNPIEATGS